jgi:hypothetical protein
MPGLHPNIHKKASIHRLRLIAMGASLFVASAAAASEAVLSSRHAVYAVGEAIDVTFWVGARWMAVWWGSGATSHRIAPAASTVAPARARSPRRVATSSAWKTCGTGSK